MDDALRRAHKLLAIAETTMIDVDRVATVLANVSNRLSRMMREAEQLLDELRAEVAERQSENHRRRKAS